MSQFKLFKANADANRQHILAPHDTWGLNPAANIDIPLVTYKYVYNSKITYYARTWKLNAEPEEKVWQVWREVTQNTFNTPLVLYAGNQGGFLHAIDDFDNRISTYFPTVTLDNERSLLLNGSNQYGNAGNVFNYDVANQWSIVLRIWPDNFGAQRCIISKTYDTSNVYGYGLYTTTGGELLWQMRAPSQLREHTTTFTLTAQVFTQIALTYNGGQNINGTRLYKNGVVGVTPSSGAITTSFLTGQDFLLGRRGSSFHLSGYIDEISVWNKALSDSEVSTLYNGGDLPNPQSVSFNDSLVSYYPCGDGDVEPNMLDNQGSNDITLVGGPTFEEFV